MPIGTGQLWIIRVAVLCCAMLGVSSILAAHAENAVRDQRYVFGWVETVVLYPGSIKLAAKLDTGARTSSADVSGLERYSRDGREWVRFSLSGADGKTVEIERQVVRYARIRRSKTKSVSRPVVMLGLCVGARYREVEVNLTERGHLDYPLLIGRSSLKGAVVDPGLKFTAEPHCRKSG